MLPRQRRLNVGMFSRKTGYTTLRGSLFLVRVFKASTPYARFGLVLRGKFRSAVERNALRRTFFNALTGVEPPLGDYVFLPNRQTFTGEEVAADIHKIIRTH